MIQGSVVVDAVVHPCDLSTPNICDMGLVKEIGHRDGHVRIVLTDPSGVHFGGLKRYIRDVLLARPVVETVSVEASTTVPWTPDRRTSRPAGRP